jgi:hypothetical protein
MSQPPNTETAVAGNEIARALPSVMARGTTRDVCVTSALPFSDQKVEPKASLSLAMRRVAKQPHSPLN